MESELSDSTDENDDSGHEAQRNRSQLAEHYLRITYSTQDNMNIKRQMLSCIVKKEYKLDYTFLNMAAGHEFLNSYLIYHHPKF